MDRDWQVGNHVHPAFANAPAHFRNRFVSDKGPKEKGEVDSCAPCKCVPPPHARIDVENLIFTIPRILFELYFRQACVSYRLQQSHCGLDDMWFFNCLNVSTKLAEIHGKLPGASRHNRGDRKTIFAKSSKENCPSPPPGT